MKDIILRSAKILEGTSGHPCEEIDLRLADGFIQEVGEKLTTSNECIEIDAFKKYAMPSLIDVHVCASEVNLNIERPDSVITIDAMKSLHAMIMRGFTTFQDLAGATSGLKVAMAKAPMLLPRMNICGKALSQTSSHTDHRGQLSNASSRDF